MVVKIHQSRPSAAGSVNYNERKVAAGTAERIFLSKIDDPTNPMSTFEIYERANIRTELTSFHVSFNPDELDGMSEEKMKEFIQDWMREMGYGEQPYVIYRHNDTGRTHYHLVSTRIAEDGHRIYNGKEFKRSLDAMRKLQEKYGFHIGKREPKEKVNCKYILEPKKFDCHKPDTTQQIRDIISYALKYNFRTDNQFVCILKDYNVKAEFKPGPDKTTIMEFQGLDSKGRIRTPIITDKELGTVSYKDVKRQEKRSWQTPHRKEAARVDNIASFALSKAKDQQHFQNILRSKGITIHYSVMEDGKIHGATLIDHTTQHVFKASELKKFNLAAAIALPEREPTIREPKEMQEEKKKIDLTLADILKGLLGSHTGSKEDEKRNQEAQQHKRTIYG